jgi:hypothetical protein
MNEEHGKKPRRERKKSCGKIETVGEVRLLDCPYKLEMS